MADTYDLKTIDTIIGGFIGLMDVVFPRSPDGKDSIKIGVLKGDLDRPWFIHVEPIGAMKMRFPGLQRVEMRLDPRGVIDHTVNGGRFDTMDYASTMFMITMERMAESAVDRDAFMHDVQGSLKAEFDSIPIDGEEQ